ncbi:MAG: nuclear transport factor 2 family protein, partial [Chloroflexi bacterium]|nr:nuclear transport factor 2 family protein [Chloroflexota bacterium]
NSPQYVANLVAQRLNRGDLDGIMALYEPNAGLAPQPGQVLQGAAAIRQGFAGFIALKPSMNMESETVAQADDVAIVYTKWSLSATGPDGSAVNMNRQAIDVMRRQPDGTRLCVIDNPFGSD